MTKVAWDLISLAFPWSFKLNACQNLAPQQTEALQKGKVSLGIKVWNKIQKEAYQRKMKKKQSG